MPSNKKRFSCSDKKTCILLQDKSLPIQKIAEIMDRSYKTVYNFLKRYKCDGNTEKYSNCGRQRKFTERCDRKLRRLYKNNRQASAQQLMKLYNEGNSNSIGITTVRKRLKEFGAKRRCLRKTVIIRKEYLLKRRKWAKARLHWTVERDWKQFIYSDECSIYVGKENKSVKVWRTDAEKDKHYLNTSSRCRQVGCMFWGCITYNGTATLTPVAGNINSEKYISILEEYLKPVLASEFPDNDGVFMDDNAPCHRSGTTTEYLDGLGIKCSEWPPQSPDLNPIENTWKIVKEELHRTPMEIKNKQDLIREVTQIWQDISTDTVRSLYNTISRRLKAVLTMKGHMTKY